MKKLATFLAIISVLGLADTPLTHSAQPFNAGNLVIYRVGDGIAVLTNGGNRVFLDEYTTNGVLVRSIRRIPGAHDEEVATPG